MNLNLNDWRNAVSRLFQKSSAEGDHRETIALGIQRMEDRQVLSATGGEVMLFSVAGAGIDLPSVDPNSDPIHAEAQDVIQYDGSQFEILFDGSSVQNGDGTGLGGDIDGLAYIGDNQFLFSFAAETTIDGVSYGSSDIVLFQADSLGLNNTSGQFSLFVDGVDLLGSAGESANIVGFDILEDGTLIVSTAAAVHNLSIGADGGSVLGSDIIQIIPDANGSYADGTRTLLFDGSDVGLNILNSENVDAVSANGLQLHLSTMGSTFVEPYGPSGSMDDVLTFTGQTFGEDTSGSFVLSFDGSVALSERFNLNALDYADLSQPTNPPTAGDVEVTLDEDTPTLVQLAGDDGDPDLDQVLTYQIVDGPDFGVVTGFDPATGTLTYLPNADFHGTDTLTYLVHDVDADGVTLTSNMATVSLTINSVNDAPVVNVGQSEFTGNEGEPVVIQGLTVGDLEAESGNAPVTVVLNAQNGVLAVVLDSTPVQVTGNGTAEVTLNGTVAEINAILAGGVTFTPADGFFGQTTVELTIQDQADSAALEASGTVQIDIAQAPEDPPEPPGDPMDPADAFRDRIRELVKNGEIRPAIGRSLLRLVQHERIPQINRAILRVRLLDRLGRIDGDTADELTGILKDLKQEVREDGHHSPRGVDKLFAKFAKHHFARHRGARR